MQDKQTANMLTGIMPTKVIFFITGQIVRISTQKQVAISTIHSVSHVFLVDV